jgi:hypothetical protein
MDNLSVILQQCKWALSDEIKEVREKGGQKSFISDGKLLGQKMGIYLYSFLADSELKFPDETQVDIEVNNKKYPGTIISIVGFDLIIGVAEYFGNIIHQAILFTAPWFLLEELQKRIDELETSDNGRRKLAIRLLSGNPSPHIMQEDQVDSAIEKIQARLGTYPQYNEDQIAAITTVISRSESFIWGPPGTGKSSTLGLTAAVLNEMGKSVLIVAHSNAAVDVAIVNMMKYSANSTQYENSEIIRLGPTKNHDIEKYPKLNIHEGIRLIDPPLYQELKTIEKRRDELVQRARSAKTSEFEQERIKNDLFEVKSRLLTLRERIRVMERDLLTKAKIIGCTLSKATISPDIFNRRFDTVLLDEASMAYIPHCLFASSLALERIAIYGDFRQLAPIAQAETAHVRKWLQRDIFDEAGIIRKVESNLPDHRLVLLRTQYRMHSKISEIPNVLFYQNRLKDGKEVNRNSDTIVKSAPYEGKSVSFIDLGVFPAHCFMETTSHSRFNFFSALIAVEMALKAAQKGDVTVGIISPYNAQSRLILRMLADLGQDLEKVKASTVHKFQGSERDVIIFDATDGAPRKEIGLIYQDLDASRRLANVAISRAKGKFIFLCNRGYLISRLDNSNGFQMILNMMRNAFDQNALHLSTFTGMKIFDLELPGINFFPAASLAKEPAEKDLSNAKEEIAINWPEKDRNPFFSAYAMKTCDPKKVHFSFTGTGQEIFRKIGLENTRFWTSTDIPTIGLVGIDRKILWIMPEAQTVNNFVLRLELAKTVPMLIDFWNLAPGKKTSEGIACSKCNGKMWYNFDEYNRLRMKCTSCGWTRYFSREDATYYALFMGKTCEKCGGQLVGKDRGTGVFLGCADYPDCKWTLSAEKLFY